MKSKRRHELQTNELADRLGHWIENVRPHLTMITLLVVGGLAIIAAWYYYASTRESEIAQAWRAYMNAGTDPSGNIVGELGDVAADYEGTQAGLWAAQTAADMQSAQGVRLLFQDRDSATKILKEAQQRYETVLDSKKTSAMLSHRAHFGLAQTLEALGDLDDAKTQYEAVITAAKETAIAHAAEQRLARLELALTQKFYNWFSRQKPAPRDLGTGAGGKLGTAGKRLGNPAGRAERRLHERRTSWQERTGRHGRTSWQPG